MTAADILEFVRIIQEYQNFDMIYTLLMCIDRFKIFLEVAQVHKGMGSAQFEGNYKITVRQLTLIESN